MNALDSDRPGAQEQIPRANVWTVGVLLVALGAGLCALALVELTSSKGGPAESNPDIASEHARPTVVSAAPIPTPIPETERRIMEALAKPFPAASRPKGKVTFREAIERIAKLLPVPIDLDSQALNDANFNSAEEVQFPSDQRTVGQVLEGLLSSARNWLDWGVVNGTMTITTVDAATERFAEMRVYDVTDLTEPVVTPEGAEAWESEQLLNAIRMSSASLANGEDNLSALNVNGRTLLVARLRRRVHQELVGSLAKMRSVANAAPQPTAQRRRRVVQAARLNTALPKSASEADVAALQGLITPASDSILRVVDANCNAFTFDLYRQLRRSAPVNAAVCPFGIYVTLALLREGATGEVERQIGQALHARQSPADLQTLLGGLSDRLRALNLLPDYELSIQSCAWYDQGVPVPQAFTAALRDHYHTEITSVPFLDKPGDAAALINNWVKGATNERIEEIITPAAIAAGKIDLAITNAVFFRGLWAKPFDRKTTVQAPFHSAGKTFDVVMMRGKNAEEFPLGELEGVQILELPYRSGLMSALILLPPDSPGALEGLEASISTEKLKQYRQVMRNSLVKVELPRFEIASDFRLEETLKAMGIPRAFVPSADFSKLGRAHSRLAYLRQKTLLKVNEEGTEATSASMGGLGGGVAQERLFRADRPFLFLIRENSTGLILFVARVTDPRQGM